MAVLSKKYLPEDMQPPRWLALVHAVEALSAATSMDEVIAILRCTARDISAADGITFVLRDGEHCHYVEESSVAPLWKGQRFPLTACISGWCMLNDRMAVIPDIEIDPRIPQAAYRPTFVKSLIMAPVRTGQPIAAIGAYWAHKKAFGDEDVALLEALARSTSATLAAIAARDASAQSEAQLSLALSAGGLGAWEIDLLSGDLIITRPFDHDPGHKTNDRISQQGVQGVIHPDDWAPLLNDLSQMRDPAARLAREIRWKMADGAFRTLEMRASVIAEEGGKPTRLGGISVDITQRKQDAARVEQMQVSLAQTGRLNDMGQLASTFAHELGQPLSAVSNYTLAARRCLAQGDTARVDILLGKIAHQAVSMAEIIRRVRGYVGSSRSEREEKDLKELIADALELAQIDPAHRGIEVRRAYEPALPRVHIDSIQIQQVLVNVLRNAFEALADQPRRKVEISVRQQEQMVEIAVCDNGTGLASDIQDRLFQPFVSSKPRGMGVGLSVCRAIVENHGGTLTGCNGAGGGAEFRFTLPITAV